MCLESVSESIEYLTTHVVDLILSDIQLADGLSFEIFEKVKLNCPIIFTTAYNQYAITAFETNGIDYLLKPIKYDRLLKAVAKLNTLNKSVDMQSLISSIKASKINYKKRFLIKVGEKIKSIPISEITSFYSLQKGTFLLTNSGRNYVVDFFKINRKCIVSINGISEINVHSNSRLKLKVPHLEFEDVIVAREKVNEFKSWLDN